MTIPSGHPLIGRDDDGAAADPYSGVPARRSPSIILSRSRPAIAADRKNAVPNGQQIAFCNFDPDYGPAGASLIWATSSACEAQSLTQPLREVSIRPGNWGTNEIDHLGGVCHCVRLCVGLGPISGFQVRQNGTVVDYSDGSQTTWQAQHGNTCLTRNKSPTGDEVATTFYAPTLSLRADRSQAFAQQVKSSTLWPLTVGKKLTGRYEGVGTDSTGTGSWSETVTVDSYEKLTTKAGTFDVFVITRKEDALSSTFKSTLRQWYAPALGVTVKFTFVNNSGANRAAEAVSIR